MFHISITATLFLLAGTLCFVTADAILDHPELRVNLGTLTPDEQECDGPQGSHGHRYFWYTVTLYGNTLMRLCHNREKHSTIWSVQDLDGSALQLMTNSEEGAIQRNGSTEEGAPSNSTVESSTSFTDPLKMYPGHTIYYSKIEQRKTLGIILGQSEDYIKEMQYITEENYLAHGHLTSRMNFQTEIEKDATYFLANAVPQWQKINNGNWKDLEISILTYARITKTQLRIETGALGVLCFQDNDNTQPFYLNMIKKDDMWEQRVPVPRIIYKKVTDKKRHKTVVFLVENNQFLDRPPPHICRDMCSNLNWLRNVELRNYERGYTYCCEEPDFTQAIKNDSRFWTCP